MAPLRRLLPISLLVLASVALTARADVSVFDDPAQTAHPTLLNFSAVNSTQTSISFSNNNQKYADVLLKITACVTCNVTFQIWAKDISGQGNDYIFCADATAITAIGSYHYTVGPLTDAVNVTNGFVAPIGIRLNCKRPLPVQWYIAMVWNSGTSVTGSVRAYSWH